MSGEIDELIEDEYAAQQEEAEHIHPVKINSENKKKSEIEVGVLLVDISETLRLLNDQIVLLNATTKILPETVSTLKTMTESVQCIANELPSMVREQCLEEYKKILANAVKNYNQMQKSAYKWQNVIERRSTRYLKCFFAFESITLVLLLLNLVLM